LAQPSSAGPGSGAACVIDGWRTVIQIAISG
jgi:hypothetical protein